MPAWSSAMQSNPIFATALRAERQPRLSERQLECLAWVQEGKSATDIGQIIGISGRTVEGHLAKVCEALGVRTRIQAVLRASDLGLLSGAAAPALHEPGRSFRVADRR
jgi:DNA-binding CsgD family transcriptional regulator